MSDQVDALLDAAGFAPPADFAQRMTALARDVPQHHAPAPPKLRLWQWLSLGAGAGAGSLVLGQFVFFAFAATGAQ